MNKITTWAAITMFAVTLGLGLMSPAMATPADDDGEHKMQICHYQAEKVIVDPDTLEETTIPAEWALINVDNAGKLKGHFDKEGVTRHFENEPADGDFVIDEDVVDNTLQDCLDLLPVEEEAP